MAIKDDILRLLRDEGYRLNEAVTDALDEFLTVVEDEAEGEDDDYDEEYFEGEG